MASKYRDAPIGKSFGDWIVKGYSHHTNEHYWVVECKCGDVMPRRATQLALGRTKSCRSCAARKREGNLAVSWTGLSEMSGQYLNRIVHSARRRGLVVEIIMEDLYAQWEKQDRKCALSGITLSLRFKGVATNATASVDRIDSSKGYIKGNIQWVHKDINIMKHSLDESYFINLCGLIASYCEVYNEK